MAGAKDRLQSPALRRLPFTDIQDVADAVVDFCVGHGSPYDRALVRRLLCTMTSDPGGAC